MGQDRQTDPPAETKPAAEAPPRKHPNSESKSCSAAALGAVTTDKTSTRLHRPCTLMLCRAKNTGWGGKEGELGEEGGHFARSGSLLISRAS